MRNKKNMILFLALFCVAGIIGYVSVDQARAGDGAKTCLNGACADCTGACADCPGDCAKCPGDCDACPGTASCKAQCSTGKDCAATAEGACKNACGGHAR